MPVKGTGKHSPNARVALNTILIHSMQFSAHVVLSIVIHIALFLIHRVVRVSDY